MARPKGSKDKVDRSYRAEYNVKYSPVAPQVCRKEQKIKTCFQCKKPDCTLGGSWRESAV